MKITIGWLYPDLMSTYGDRGNIICLKKRCQWRGIETRIEEISLQSTVNSLQKVELLFMGGAQDRQQKIASQDLRENKGPVIKKMIEDGVPGLFVCAAYQFLGHYYRPAEGEEIPGLGIFDLYTVHPGKEKERLIGNVVIKTHNPELITPNHIVGFENHGGRTYLGERVEPLGKVLVGYGNNGDLPASLDGRQWQAGDKTEGCIYKNAIGSYLHGPILPKNPHLADYLIKIALCKKYGDAIKLIQLNDSLEWQAHNAILAKSNIK